MFFYYLFLDFLPIPKFSQKLAQWNFLDDCMIQIKCFLSIYFCLQCNYIFHPSGISLFNSSSQLFFNSSFYLAKLFFFAYRRKKERKYIFYIFSEKKTKRNIFYISFDFISQTKFCLGQPWRNIFIYFDFINHEFKFCLISVVS